MAHSNRLSATTKKPHPDYPLTPRSDGRWAKKIKGKVYIISGPYSIGDCRPDGAVFAGKSASSRGGLSRPSQS